MTSEQAQQLEDRIDSMLAEAIPPAGSAGAVEAELDAEPMHRAEPESPSEPSIPTEPTRRGQGMLGLTFASIALVLMAYSAFGAIAAVWIAGVILLAAVTTTILLVGRGAGVRR